MQAVASARARRRATYDRRLARRPRGYDALFKSSGVAGQTATDDGAAVAKWEAVVSACADGTTPLPASVRFIPKGVHIVLITSVCALIVPLFVTCAVVAIRAELVPSQRQTVASVRTPIGLFAASALLLASALVTWRAAHAMYERYLLARGHFRLGLFLVPRSALGLEPHEPCLVLRLRSRPGSALVIPASKFIAAAEYREFNPMGGLNDELELRFSHAGSVARARFHAQELQAGRAELVAALEQWAAEAAGGLTAVAPVPPDAKGRAADDEMRSACMPAGAEPDLAS